MSELRELRWSNEDPRISIYKSAKIVIVRPGGFGTSLADVETKHGYWILTSYEDHPVIDAAEEWDQDWVWIFAPNS